MQKHLRATVALPCLETPWLIQESRDEVYLSAKASTEMRLCLVHRVQSAVPLESEGHVQLLLTAVVESRRTKVAGSTAAESHHQWTRSTPPVTEELVLVATARTAVECLLVCRVFDRPMALFHHRAGQASVCLKRRWKAQAVEFPVVSRSEGS